MKNIIFTVALLIIFSCGNKKVENEKVSEVKSEKITFTKDQIALAGIETGVLELKPVSAKIMCKGRVEAMPESRAKISVPMSGYISKILVHNGSLVAKGQAILVLQHPDYIELQKKYLQAKSKFEFLEKDYHRQKSLADQNAGTGKIFEKTKSDYEELKIEISALKLQLKMLNINSENLTSENIKSEITVFSPLTGNVNEVWITLGQFVKPEDVMFEIVGNFNYQIELQVFERDINRIFVGQKVVFDCSMPESSDIVNEATIESVGNYVDEITKTFKVQAKPKSCNQKMRQGLFVNAEININEQNIHVLPEFAVLNDGKNDFVFLAQPGGLFEKHIVNVGIRESTYIEILDSELIGKQIVVKGANYIIGELNKE